MGEVDILIKSKVEDQYLFARLFDHAPIGMALVSPGGNLLRVNPALCTMLGYSEHELNTLTFQAITFPDDLEQNLVYQQEVLEGLRDRYQMEKRYIHKSGEVIWCLLSVTAERDSQGNPDFFISQLVDITEHKEMEMRLSEREARYRSLIQHAPVGICAVNLDGYPTEANPAFEFLTGYSMEELLSMNFQELIFPSIREDVVINSKTVLDKSPHIGEITIKHKSGSPIDVVAIRSPIIIHGETKGIYFLIRDISDKKQTDELLQQAEKLSLIGELAAGIAHEIRNPLTSLRGFIQLFKSGYIDDKSMHYEIMISEIDRINEIVSELLLLAKPSGETVETRSMAKELGHVITLLEAESNLFNVTIRRDFEDNLPFIRCQINMRQVFINLLKNSIEAMPKGGEIVVQLKRIEDKICIRFIDQGCGIPQDQLVKLGQPFFTTKDTGTGLGMMVSQRIVQTHGGIMQIESQEGKGTTVEIMLPIPTESN